MPRNLARAERDGSDVAMCGATVALVSMTFGRKVDRPADKFGVGDWRLAVEAMAPLLYANGAYGTFAEIDR
ncbi:hypothetical protein ACEPUD_31200 [Burkholderia ubonensis]|uniref:hypothetical protein n=1 Tax=Burkholderia ubonensis TaxID=101571 RepID=UPI0035900BB3